MSLSESELQGGLLLRLLQDDPLDGDWKTLEKWNVPQARLNVYLTSTKKVEDDIKASIRELQEPGALRAPQNMKQLHAKMSQRDNARTEWNRELLKGVVFKKIKAIEALEKEAQELRIAKQHQEEVTARLQKEAADLRVESQKQNEVLRGTENEAERLRDEVQQTAELMEDFDKKVLELGLQIQQQRDVIANLRMKLADNIKQAPLRTISTDAPVKELAHELQTKDMLVELARQKDEADKLHTIESDALKWKAQRAEALVQSFQTALRAFRISLEDIESTYSPLEKGMSKTRPRSVERTSLVETGQKEDRELSAKNEDNTEPDLRTEINPDKHEVGSKRTRDNRGTVIPEVCNTHPLEDTMAFPTTNELKEAKIPHAGEAEIRASCLEQPLKSCKKRKSQSQVIHG